MGYQILEFSLNVVGLCKPMFVEFLPFAIGLMFLATVPDILRKVIGVRE